MEQIYDAKKENQDSSCKERFHNLTKQAEQQAAKLPGEMDKQFEVLIEVTKEINSEHKYF